MKIVIRKPIIIVPLSPINILDLLPNTLCMKKGINAPSTMTAKDVHTR